MLLIVLPKILGVFPRSEVRAEKLRRVPRLSVTLNALSRNDARANHGREYLLELVETRMLFHDGASAFGRLKYLGVAQF